MHIIKKEMTLALQPLQLLTPKSLQPWTVHILMPPLRQHQLPGLIFLWKAIELPFWLQRPANLSQTPAGWTIHKATLPFPCLKDRWGEPQISLAQASPMPNPLHTPRPGTEKEELGS